MQLKCRDMIQIQYMEEKFQKRQMNDHKWSNKTLMFDMGQQILS